MTTATAFQHQKLERFFGMLDENGNGTIEWDDIEALACRLIQQLGVDPKSDKAAAVDTSFRNFWKELLLELDDDGDFQVTSEEYARGMEALFIEGPHFDRVFQPAIEAVARLCDTNDDGTIGLDEYTAMEAAFGLDPSDAEMAFRKLDVDGDGSLTVDELMTAAREYYTGDNPDSPGVWLFGTAGQ